MEHKPYWSGWLSKSQVKMYDKCPYAWYLERIVKAQPEERPELSNGKNVHEILNWVYTQKDKYSTIDELAQQMAQHPESEKFKDQIDNFITVLRYWTIAHPLHRELMVKDPDYAIIGVIDRVDMIDGQTYVVEYKWTFSDYNMVDYQFELALYAKLLEKQNKTTVEKGAVIFLNDGFVKTVKLTEEMKNEAIDRILQVRGKVFRSLAQNKFDKRIGRWCDYCQFKKHCNNPDSAKKD